MPKERRVAEAESMPEAEVTLRLAFWLLHHAEQKSHADVAIDGAHVRIAAHEQAGRRIEERTVFDIRSFLAENKCYPRHLGHEWRGTYSFEGHTVSIRSVHGFDVQVRCNDKEIRAECKGGPLQPKGQSASAVFASAIGQVIVSSSDAQSEELWVAVPDSPTFENVARRIIKGRAFANTGIKIALVSKAGVRLLG
jgi:hypothetical protein